MKWRLVRWRVLTVLGGAGFYGGGALLMIALPGVRALVFAVLWLSVLGAMVLYYGAAEADQRERQRLRNRRAAKRLNDMLAGQVDFFLYLRPFASAGGVQVVRAIRRRPKQRADRYLAGTGSHSLLVQWNDLEALIARSFERQGLVVGVGRPGDLLGAAKLPTDDEHWQDLVTDLATHARLVFLLPASDPGTAWEADLVLGQPALLRKTVFVVPGTSHYDDYLSIEGMSIEGMGVPSAFRSLQEADRLRRTSGRRLEGWREGASREPARGTDALREGALIWLRNAGVSAALERADQTPTASLLMLAEPSDGERPVRAHYALSGRVGPSGNLLDDGPAFELDLRDLDHALHDYLARADHARTNHTESTGPADDEGA